MHRLAASLPPPRKVQGLYATPPHLGSDSRTTCATSHALRRPTMTRDASFTAGRIDSASPPPLSGTLPRDDGSPP